MNERKCFSCKYGEQSSCTLDIFGVGYKCHRFPPIFIRWPMGETHHFIVDFPPVGGEDFCGEFKEKEDASN